MYTHIYRLLEMCLAEGAGDLEGSKGVPRNGGRKQQLVRSCFALDSLHVRTLALTDVQTPFFGTPLVPLKGKTAPGGDACGGASTR